MYVLFLQLSLGERGGGKENVAGTLLEFTACSKNTVVIECQTLLFQ
jgi:hypothetical protein